MEELSLSVSAQQMGTHLTGANDFNSYNSDLLHSYNLLTKVLVPQKLLTIHIKWEGHI